MEFYSFALGQKVIFMKLEFKILILFQKIKWD